MSREERLAFENKDPIYLYKTASSKPVDFKDNLSCAGKSSVWLTNPRCTLSSDPPGPNETQKHAVENITTGTTPCTSHPSLTDFGDCYVSLQNLCYFAQSQLISIMFGILYPIFLQIPNKEEFLQCETEVEETAENENTTEPCVFTKSSRRAQECLLSCAANFDETHLYQHLKLADWVDVIAEAFDHHPLPITISDVNRPGHPFVYVNKTFAVLVGESPVCLLGKKGLGMLTGPDTEGLLLDQLQEAQEARSACKLAITHYGAGKKRFLNLLALKPSGGYMFAVHCSANRTNLQEDLQVTLLLYTLYIFTYLPV